MRTGVTVESVEYANRHLRRRGTCEMTGSYPVVQDLICDRSEGINPPKQCPDAIGQ